MFIMSSNRERRKNFLINLLHNRMGDNVHTKRMDPSVGFSREEIVAACTVFRTNNTLCTYRVPPAWLVNDNSRRVSRGVYLIPEVAVLHAMIYPHLYDDAPAPVVEKVEESSLAPLDSTETSDRMCNMNSNTYNLVLPMSEVSLVPAKNDTFVPWGHYDTIATILASKQFAPIYITGLSGNGKTTMIEQICAANGRDLVRVNITSETDEDDLLGGFRLVNGETKFVYGPVVQAMQKGAILLLDEIDLGSERMMCLQPVLEGKGIYLKKIGQYVRPSVGFNAVATANTKGKGESDRFVGTRVMNEAFLDRFSYWFEQDYADRTVEARIIIRKMKAYGREDKEFAQYLTKWAETIRLGFKEGGLDDIITTRRLEEVCKAFAIFSDKEKAIKLTLTRFDPATQKAFFDLYTKIDPTILPMPDGADKKAQPVAAPTDTSYALNA
jgi:5-formyltetrahydrofolate cyclo-ligase